MAPRSATKAGDEKTPGAELIPLRTSHDSSYEIELDDEPEEAQKIIEGIPLPPLASERREIIPKHLRTLAGIKKTAARYARTAGLSALM
jgi:hypothetical protein